MDSYDLDDTYTPTTLDKVMDGVAIFSGALFVALIIANIIRAYISL